MLWSCWPHSHTKRKFLKITLVKHMVYEQKWGSGASPEPPRKISKKSDANSHFFCALGTPNGHPKAPQNQKKQLRHDLFPHSFFHGFSTTCFLTFCHLSGWPGPRKCGQNAVLSFKIKGTTLSRRKRIFSKIPPKVTPQATPETIQNQKKHLPDPL